MNEKMQEMLSEKLDQAKILNEKVIQQAQEVASYKSKLNNLQLTDTLNQIMKKNEEVYSAVVDEATAQKTIKVQRDILNKIQGAYLTTIQEQGNLDYETNQLISAYLDIIQLLIKDVY